MSRVEGERVRGEAYLRLEPKWLRRFGEDELVGFTVAGVTAKRPTRARPNSTGVVVIALDLDLPVSAFEPLRPTVAIVVGEGDAQAVRVTVTPPADEDGES